MFGFDLPMRSEVFLYYLTGGRSSKKYSKIVQVTDETRTSTQAKAYDSYQGKLRSNLYSSSSISSSGSTLSSESSDSDSITDLLETTLDSAPGKCAKALLSKKISLNDIASLSQKELLDLQRLSQEINELTKDRLSER